MDRPEQVSDAVAVRSPVGTLLSLALHGAAAIVAIVLAPLLTSAAPPEPPVAEISIVAFEERPVPEPAPPAPAPPSPAKSAAPPVVHRAIAAPVPIPAPIAISAAAAESAPVSPATGDAPPMADAGNGSPAASPDYQMGARDTPYPAYPANARRRGREGLVVIRLEVSAEGLPDNVEIVESSGDESLDNAARTTLARWTLRPATRNGRPVPGSLVVPVRFQLR